MSNKSYPLERIELADLHRDLFEAGLVVSTGGNISSRVNDGFLIKPSGVALSGPHSREHDFVHS